MIRTVPVSNLVAATFLVATALFMVTAGVVQAETADEAALRGAARDEKQDEVERLLDKGTDPNVPDHRGWTAVHHAAAKGGPLILSRLLRGGRGDPNVKDFEGNTPLHLVAVYPFSEGFAHLSVNWLMRWRASPDEANDAGQTPLHLLSRTHQTGISIGRLMAEGADPDRADHRGDTALHYAVGRDSKLSARVVEALVDGGADGNVRGASGETPLQLFVRVGSNDGRIVDALVDAGADVDAKNPDGESPLHTAVRNGGSSENNRVVEALLAAAADPCIKDASGYIPYNTAREGGEVHTMLANAGGSDIGCQGSEDIVADYVVDPADWPGETTARSNIRSGPGTDHGVVTTLDVGTSVHVTGTVRNTDWLRVDAAGETAFVHASLVNRIETATAMEPSGEDSDAVFGTKPESAEDTTGESGVETADQEEVSGVDTTVAPINTEPKCADDTPRGSACWRELHDYPGCHVWTDSYSGPRSVTWTGTCSGGFADGHGSLTMHYPPPPDGNGQFIRESTGRLVEGVRQGHWVDAREFSRGEGDYVDGRRHGHWIMEGESVGGIYAENFEGSYVDGLPQGHWSSISTDGNFIVEGSFVDGQPSGLWTWDNRADNTYTTMPYVEGKPHGQSSWRNYAGETFYQCWHQGEEVAC